MTTKKDAADGSVASNCSTVELRVILGGDNMIYAKRVQMPILPVGSSVRISKDLHLYVFGYWFSVVDSVTSCWLTSWRQLQDANQPDKEMHGFELRFAAIESYNLRSIDLKLYKKDIVEAGFVRTGQRMESCWK